MKLWQYKVIQFENEYCHDEPDLNKAGQEGYELVSVIFDGRWVRLYMRREYYGPDRKPLPTPLPPREFGRK
jgi:hypothetical protein